MNLPCLYIFFVHGHLHMLFLQVYHIVSLLIWWSWEVHLFVAVETKCWFVSGQIRLRCQVGHIPEGGLAIFLDACFSSHLIHDDACKISESIFCFHYFLLFIWFSFRVSDGFRLPFDDLSAMLHMLCATLDVGIVWNLHGEKIVASGIVRWCWFLWWIWVKLSLVYVFVWWWFSRDVNWDSAWSTWFLRFRKRSLNRREKAYGGVLHSFNYTRYCLLQCRGWVGRKQIWSLLERNPGRRKEHRGP